MNSNGQFFKGMVVLLGLIIFLSFIGLVLFMFETDKDADHSEPLLEAESAVSLNEIVDSKWTSKSFSLTMRSINDSQLLLSDIEIRFYRKGVLEEVYSTEKKNLSLAVLIDPDLNPSTIAKGEIFVIDLNVSHISFLYHDPVLIEFVKKIGEEKFLVLCRVNFIMPENVNMYEKLI